MKNWKIITILYIVIYIVLAKMLISKTRCQIGLLAFECSFWISSYNKSSSIIVSLLLVTNYDDRV